MSVLRVVHIHGGSRERRRQLARALQDLGVTVLLSSNAAEAAKCFADAQVHISVIFNDALVAETIQTLRHDVQCVQPSRTEPVGETTHMVLQLLRQCVPT